MIKKGRVLSENLYYCALIVYVLANNLQLSYAYIQWSTSGNSMLIFLQLLRYLSYALCFSRLIFLRRLNQAYLWIGFLLLVGSVVASLTGTANSPFFYFLFFVAGVKTDFKKTVKIFFVVQFATFVLYIFCGITGIIGGGTIVQTGRTRSFLGYGWVNRAAYCLLFMIIEYLYIIDYKLQLLHAIAMLFINIYIYVKTKTFFPFVVTVVVISIGLYFNCRQKKNKRLSNRTWKKIHIYFILTVVLGFALPILYKSGNRVWYLVNRFMTGRLALAQNAIQRYGLHIWGNKVEWVGSSTLLFGLSNSNEYFYVDAGFLNLALEFGLLFVGIIAFIYFKNISVARIKNDSAMALCLFILFALFIFEPYVIDFSFNPFPLYYISTLSSLRKKGVDEKVNELLLLGGIDIT